MSADLPVKEPVPHVALAPKAHAPIIAPSPKKRAAPNPANFHYKNCTEVQKKDKRRHCK